MIVTCTPSGPVRPRLIQHELLVVLEFDKYCNWWLWLVRHLVQSEKGYCYIPGLSVNWTGTAIGWFLVTWPWLKSNVPRSWYILAIVSRLYTLQQVIKAWWKVAWQKAGKHCQFSFSWINTTTQTWSLKLKEATIFKVIPEEKQQLLEEEDADKIRKVLCKWFIDWFWELNLCSYKNY